MQYNKTNFLKCLISTNDRLVLWLLWLLIIIIISDGGGVGAVSTKYLYTVKNICINIISVQQSDFQYITKKIIQK